MARMEPLRFSREPNTRGGIEELADNYSASSYQGRNLGIAMKLCGRSLHNGSVIGLTVAGAMTPAGHGGYYAQLMAHGAIDFIVATGANLTHDMHFVQGARVEQCEPLNSPTDKPDHELIYDTMLYPEALSMVDEAVRDFVSAFDHKCEMSSSQFYHEFGGYLLQRYQKDRDAPLEDISMLVAAHKYDVPIYTPDFMNSEIGMALLMAHIDGVSKLNVSALVDIEQITGLMYTCSRSSPIFLIIIGGGGPKNFATQTGPLIIEDITIPGSDDAYKGISGMAKFTAEPPHWGSCSGAPPEESAEWKKIDRAAIDKNEVVVLGDVTITFPLVVKYMLTKTVSRRLKRLFKEQSDFCANLRAARQVRVEAVGYKLDRTA